MIRIALLALALLAGAPPATAQVTAPPATAEQRQVELQAAWDAAQRAGTRGPAEVALLDQARLRIPKGQIFIPEGEAGRLLRAYGNRNSPSLVGAVMPLSDDEDWIAVVRFIREGFVRDDDAKDWKADELLASLRAGTEEANKDRAQRGFPELEITGWLQKPEYDAASHRLVWSLGSRRKGEPAGSDGGVNYNTYALGRDGYFSLNLITTESDLPADRKQAAALLADLDYVEGKRYTDHNPATDPVAAYGLAALVGVVAAKKLGLIALIGVFVAKFAKVGLLAVAGLGVLAAKLFKRKPQA